MELSVCAQKRNALRETNERFHADESDAYNIRESVYLWT